MDVGEAARVLHLDLEVEAGVLVTHPLLSSALSYRMSPPSLFSLTHMMLRLGVLSLNCLNDGLSIPNDGRELLQDVLRRVCVELGVRDVEDGASSGNETAGDLAEDAIRLV